MADLPDFIPADQVIGAPTQELPDFIPADQVIGAPTAPTKEYRFGPIIGGTADKIRESLGIPESNQPMGQQLLGAAGMIGNAAIPFFDEIAGAAMPGVSAEDIRQAQAEFDESMPGVVKYPLQIAAAIKSPINKLATNYVGKAKTGWEGIKRAVPAAFAEGFLFGAGSGEGTTNRIEKGIIGGGLSAPFGLLGGLAGSRTPRAQAAEELATAGGDDIAKMQIKETAKELAEDPFYQYRTLAEETQNPNLAQMEQTLFKSENPLNAEYTARDTARKAQQVKEIREGLGTFASKEQAGSTVRSGLQKLANEAKALANAKRRSVDQSILYDVLPLKKAAEDVKGMFVAMDIPEGVAEPLRKIDELVEGDLVDMKYLHQLRKNAQSVTKKLEKGGDRDIATEASGRLVAGIDDLIEAKGQPEWGDLYKDNAERFAEFKKLFANYADDFRSGNVGKILKEKRKKGDYRVEDYDVIRTLWDGKPETTRNILRAAKTPKEREATRKGVTFALIEKATGGKDVFSADKFRQQFNLQREALEASLPDGSRLFDNSHLKIVNRVGRDLDLTDPTSLKSVRQLAYRASIGQPTTGQTLKLMQDVATQRLPMPAVIRNYLEARGMAAEKAKELILSRAMLDKSFAKKLAGEANMKSLSWAAKAIPELVASASLFLSVPMSNTKIEIEPTPSYDFEVEASEPQIPELAIGELPSIPDGIKKQDISALIDEQPPLVKAIIAVESSGNPTATSKAGAQGLMQLMPANSKKLGIDPFDPAQNIQAGKRILAEEMDRYNDPFLALAAYNAGSPRIDAAMKQAGSNRWEDIKPYLPKETQNYPDKVFEVLGGI